MKYAVKLNVNGTADIVEVPDQRDWRWYSRQIGCEYIEIDVALMPRVALQFATTIVL